jgi:hypothetical protein
MENKLLITSFKHWIVSGAYRWPNTGGTELESREHGCNQFVECIVNDSGGIIMFPKRFLAEKDPKMVFN